MQIQGITQIYVLFIKIDTKSRLTVNRNSTLLSFSNIPIKNNNNNTNN